VLAGPGACTALRAVVGLAFGLIATRALRSISWKSARGSSRPSPPLAIVIGVTGNLREWRNRIAVIGDSSDVDVDARAAFFPSHRAVGRWLRELGTRSS